MAEQPFNAFPIIAARMHGAFSALARAAAFKVQAGYQERCRVDTSAQKNSAYVVTNQDSTYDAAASAAQAANPHVTLLPEVDKPTSDTEAVVAVGVNYALINEVGGVHHTGDGAMAKAVDAERGPFRQAVARVENWKP